MFPIVQALVLAFTLTLPALLQAQSSVNVEDSPLQLNISYSQQEQGTISVDLLAPQMGTWGRLGLHGGNSSYFSRDEQGKSVLDGTSELGLVWSLEEGLMPFPNAILNRDLGFRTNLRYGELRYTQGEGAASSGQSFNFLEFEWLFTLRSSLKGDLSQKWVKASTLGLGTGARFNASSKIRTIGQTEVQTLRVYPTLQFSLSLF